VKNRDGPDRGAEEVRAGSREGAAPGVSVVGDSAATAMPVVVDLSVAPVMWLCRFFSASTQCTSVQ
jgi:hypothetical protein